MGEVFGLTVSEGAIANILARAQTPLLAAVAPMAAPMRASPVVGSVETSARVCGKTPAFAGACMVAVGAAEFDGDLPRHRRHPSRRGGDLRAGTAPVRHPRVKPKDKH